jgi:hypothetical protein
MKRPTAKAKPMSAEQVAAATRRLRYVQADAKHVAAFMFVCIEALRAQRRSEVDADVATVLESAFEKILLVEANARDALKALGQASAIADRARVSP